MNIRPALSAVVECGMDVAKTEIANTIGIRMMKVRRKTMGKRKYKKGGPITSLEELAKQDFVYFFDKIQPKGWFKSWQIRYAEGQIKLGRIFYAIKTVPDTIICKKCNRRFADESELKRFVEIQQSVDDILVLPYSKELSEEPNSVIIRGCPYCMTNAYLMDLEFKE